MQTSDAQRPLKIGELARRTGLTVRTLHHYDEIGLLRPAERTYAGHRLYRRPEIRRLHRIVALRSLGVPLDTVAGMLEREAQDPRAAIREHLAALDERLRATGELRARLVRILGALEEIDGASSADYLAAIERTTMLEKHYTPDQLDWLARRREELGEDAIRDVEDEWPRLYAAMRVEMSAGSDPSGPRPQAIAARMRELVAMFHGANAPIKQVVADFWRRTPREEMIARLEAQGVEDAAAHIPEPELTAYVERAHEAGQAPPARLRADT
jgi:MerR family transcriptional regulator, thiopeptide resistance regulator